MDDIFVFCHVTMFTMQNIYVQYNDRYSTSVNKHLYDLVDVSISARSRKKVKEITIHEGLDWYACIVGETLPLCGGHVCQNAWCLNLVATCVVVIAHKGDSVVIACAAFVNVVNFVDRRFPGGPKRFLWSKTFLFRVVCLFPSSFFLQLDLLRIELW